MQINVQASEHTFWGPYELCWMCKMYKLQACLLVGCLGYAGFGKVNACMDAIRHFAKVIQTRTYR
jgi:hypothetical protein